MFHLRCNKCSFHQKSILHLATRSFSNSKTQELRSLFENHATKTNKRPLDWYHLSPKMMDEKVKAIISTEFQGSMYKALSTIFPETEWLPWKFKYHPPSPSYWKEQSNQRKFFDYLGKQIGIQTLDDWYDKITVKLIRENGGDDILALYENSATNALMKNYPEHNWILWKFKTVPNGFWKDMSTQKNFFDDLGKQLGVSSLDDWYEKLSKNVVLEHGGSGVLSQYGFSPTTAIMNIYPEHKWIPWKFNYVSQGFWNDAENRNKFFDYLATALDIKSLDDWYEKLTYDVMAEHGGYGLLHKYQGSPTAALMATYPEHNWILWKFKSVPRDYWKDINNQKKFFDELGNLLGVKELDDWYSKLSKDAVVDYGGRYLLSLYNSSPMAALMAAYPEHKWLPWKLKHVPEGYWDSKENVKQFLAYLSEKLSIQTLDDWYRVDRTQMIKFGGGKLFNKYKGLYNLLKEQYPHHPWDKKKFLQGGGKKAQRWLAVTLKKMFPNEGMNYLLLCSYVAEILEDYLHPKAIFPSSGRQMQLDVYIPSRSLAFEYQGQHHFQEVGIFGPSKQHQQRDEEKRALCAANNIKLIEVPYWWNRTTEELQEIMSH